jgi:hypothetical protein
VVLVRTPNLSGVREAVGLDPRQARKRSSFHNESAAKLSRSM